jgi:LemA protein
MDNIVPYLIIAVVIISIIIMHNTIIGRMNRAKRAWSDVITYEKLKSELIPKLVSLTEEFKIFESSFVEQITAMRTALSSISKDKIDIEQLQEIEARSNQVFSTFKATAESYPELGSTQVVRDLIAQITDKSENVAAAITIYNRSVEQFNNSTEMFPINIVNSLFAKKDKLEVFTQSGLTDKYDYKPNFS